MPTPNTVPSFLEGVAGRPEIQALVDDDTEADLRDLVSALQVVGDLALTFPLAFGNKLHVTRAGAGDYRALFVPCGADPEDLQPPRKVEPRLLRYYSELSDPEPVSIHETPLGLSDADALIQGRWRAKA